VILVFDDQHNLWANVLASVCVCSSQDTKVTWTNALRKQHLKKDIMNRGGRNARGSLARSVRGQLDSVRIGSFDFFTSWDGILAQFINEPAQFINELSREPNELLRAPRGGVNKWSCKIQH
jgi:hypothetical protein